MEGVEILASGPKIWEEGAGWPKHGLEDIFQGGCVGLTWVIMWIKRFSYVFIER